MEKVNDRLTEQLVKSYTKNYNPDISASQPGMEMLEDLNKMKRRLEVLKPFVACLHAHEGARAGGEQLQRAVKDLANEGFRIPRSVYDRVLDRYSMGHVHRAEWDLWAQVL